jgi:dihydropteroate synthase
MTQYNTRLITVKTLEDAKKEIQKIGSDPQSIDIMAPKAISRVIKIENVRLQDAVIIKQDMLSVGGDVAVPKETFQLYDKTGDILIMGSLKQLIDLVEKLERHYPRLRKIAQEIHNVLNYGK